MKVTPKIKSIILKIKTIKKRVVRVLLTAGFIKFKILYIITGKEKKIPEKIEIDTYKKKGAWGAKNAVLKLDFSFT